MIAPLWSSASSASSSSSLVAPAASARRLSALTLMLCSSRCAESERSETEETEEIEAALLSLPGALRGVVRGVDWADVADLGGVPSSAPPPTSALMDRHSLPARPWCAPTPKR